MFWVDMAAFASKDPNDWLGFSTHWNKILNDKVIIKQTIIVKNKVVGIFLVLSSLVIQKLAIGLARNIGDKE